MGVDTLQYGSDKLAFFVPEASFAAVTVPAATHALRITDFSFGRPVGRADVPDRKGTRSRIERAALRTPVQPWSLSGIMRPSGSAGTAPDIGDVLKHAFGTETVSGGVSVTYSPLKDMSALSASIYGYHGGILEGVYGAVVQNFSLSWSGDDAVQWTATGVAKDYIFAGSSPANGADTTATALVVDDADFFTVGALVQIDTDDNTGAGYQVTAVDHATETLTITPAATWSDNDVVAAFVPTGTYAGDPLYTPAGSISFDNGSTTTTDLSGNLAVATGVDLINTEHGTTSASDVTNSGMRNVTATVDFLVKTDETWLAGNWRRKVVQDFIKIMGSIAGNIVTVNGNQVEIDPDAIQASDTDAARYSATLHFLATAAGENEVSVVFT